MFGVPPIEAFEAAGTAVRRAFFVNGYGRDMPVITFSRPPGEGPKVSVAVRMSTGGGDYRATELSGAVSQAVWDEALARSRHFNRRLTPEPSPGGGPPPPRICLHSWVVTVEAWSPRNRDGPERPRRSTQDACEEGLTVAYGFELARLAVGALHACDRLDPARYRNDVARLESCGLLSGDALAAAEALNASRNPLVAEQGSFTFNSSASFEWQGETALGWQAARELWRRKITPGQRLSPNRIIGESARRVRMTGEIAIGEGAEGVLAPFEQTWVNEIGPDTWAIERMVGHPSPSGEGAQSR